MNINSKKRRINSFLAVFFISCVLLQNGCSPTYPKEMLDKAIIQLCREEYNTEVKVKIIGNTVGVYLPIEGLFDQSLSISEESSVKINDVILSVSRVTLSTDAELNFYIVIAQDPALPEIEVVLIRYVNDLKKLHFSQISRGEFANRMIVAIKLTPQMQKESVLRDIFRRLEMDNVDELIAEYLKASEVASIGDIGYWNDAFFIKDINMREFLALQIADRSRLLIMEEQKRAGIMGLDSMDGEHIDEGGKRFFRFSFNVKSINEAEPFLEEEDIDVVFGIILKAVGDVVHGYKFEDFWNIEIVNTGDNQTLFATPEEIEAFRKKKIKLEELRRWYR